ncbi:MAG: aminomethyl-transferring glycine dehydrogenase [Myxococcales bacterium]|nr:aminomethyl-transferring glycine dehydrogenase [Myxococcales bacterium]
MTSQLFDPSSPFVDRHIGPRAHESEQMLAALGLSSLDELIVEALPDDIRTEGPLALPRALTEQESLAALREMADANQVFRSYIGQGYAGTIMPPVIRRNLLENPGWYTQYTPYQAEISQGRLEMLLNYQTMISDLCGLPVANASLLDEATAAAEAMTMLYRLRPRRSTANRFFVSDACHPQVIAVVQTRAKWLRIEVAIGDVRDEKPEAGTFGHLLAYPGTDGQVTDHAAYVEQVHESGGLVAVCTDLLALTMLQAPGQWGADVVLGNSQRFGVPMGYGGPHAAFFATRDAYKRQIPGRIIGVSRDADGRPALRMALQTREQHIRRNRATSNICTAQVLLANIAAAYGCYHGPEGLRRIADRVQRVAHGLLAAIAEAGHEVLGGQLFDTVAVKLGDAAADTHAKAVAQGINLRQWDNGLVSLTIDETVTSADVDDLLTIFGADRAHFDANSGEVDHGQLARSTPFMQEECFHAHRSETDMLRYLTRLAEKDLSLTRSMIPLGSCTMKLNAAAEMEPVSWPEFGSLHPFAPRSQAAGYTELFTQLEAWLAEITGFDAISLQPNAGSQGEFAGLLAIRGYHSSRGEAERDVCLIPTSAHGTNPATAALTGMRVVAVACDDNGNIDVADLRAKATKHEAELAGLMVTYPSTHGVFETAIREICAVVHDHGGLVYMDGANLNALMGLSKIREIGADVCHLNLHKTFAIPHGGGGPGMGPIGVTAALAPFLPGHLHLDGGDASVGAVSSAAWGSASILPISWAYIAMSGGEGLTRSSKVAILSANYLAHRLSAAYPVLYRGVLGRVAHECIIDLRPLKKSCGVTVDDVAKRLMDYGFHAPTMSWPVAGTLMIEPTESEPKAELDRFCDAMLAIRAEIQAIEDGDIAYTDSALHHAPHPAETVLADTWERAYSREFAAYPVDALRDNKYWPPVSRVDNAYGDRNLVCSCPSVEELAVITAD